MQRYLVKATLLDNEGIIQTRYFECEETDFGYAKENAQYCMLEEFRSDKMPEGYIAERTEYEVWIPRSDVL